jgi:hypothetical protein
MSVFLTPEESKERNKKRDLLKKQIENYKFVESEKHKRSYHATLKKPPFKGWRLVIEVSRDKWDQGSHDYWTIPSADGPYAGQHRGGHGVFHEIDAEILILEHLIQLKKEIQAKK